jgi:ABC-2 type transport system ATP-binding protein
VFGLLGPNGAGKSTVIKMLTTLLPPTSGAARVVGLDVVRQAGAVRRAIGYVPQMVSSDSGLTGYENALISAKLYNVPRAECKTRAREALAFVGLSESSDRLVADYSGGMIRRLEIAQALLHRPRVLFLDEPTVGLDPLARRAVWEYIEHLRGEFGTSIIITTHMMEEADALCDRVVILNLGVMKALGTPEELKESLGRPDASLDDVFAEYAGGTEEARSSFRETFRKRRIARRLG